ncbi:NAD(P)H-dependent glycerol-3-phosphate dehydrogenase [Sneathia sanguinegens]|uniref:Glycerol-3-phosphate dehydrogenase [NAD(P)+] n=1 Tax=Sneathia sanguinegens TaxID=40543 RepID=A0ABT7HHI9_9FUSO|nr:NAD(P)H-dependent glycerol-3-phosphate dehydrogenase [Sneathia sanguinegens]MDK9579980.1 NAD(P)H-dependent glycerol-3-phosphate dehydrogenase [Sneathia sanguinegens]MDU7496906.1 NAD(P)H-dependent glycerol-3-phosphate dehydrogenase [Sneathia sanguinegens]
MNILTLGGGSWGTALTILLAKKGYTCYLYEHNEEYRKILKEKRENTTFLKGHILPTNIKIVEEFNEVIEKVDIILLATPTQYLRNMLKKFKKFSNKKIIVNVAKGLEIGTLKRISEIVAEELKDFEYEYVHLAGPTHAEEVAKQIPSAILSVSENEEVAKKVQEVFNTTYLRVYTGTDVIGAELAGALKNCIAIAAGISDGLGYGDNTKAALMTRGLGEMIIIGKFYKADFKTFMGLTGFGDLVVTCTSQHSRNRYLGEQIGRGRTVEEVVHEMKMVSEGATTIKALKEIIEKNNLRTPIFTELYNILYNKQSTKTITELFMNRNLRSEF